MTPAAALGALLAGAVLVVAAVWLVLRAVRSRPAGGTARSRIDPFAVQEPWRRPVTDTLAARRRFDAAVASMTPGPLRDRMAGVGERLDDGVGTLWDIARHGSSLAAARRRIDVTAIEHRLEGTSDTATVEALRSQIAAAGRLDATITDTEARLTLLVARFEQAATGAEGLSARTATPAAADALDLEVTDAVAEVAALRDALDEVRGAGGPGPIEDPGTAAGGP